MSEHVWATRFPPPRIRGTREQARTLARVVDRLPGVSDCARDVLRIIAASANGAGFAWPRVELLVHRTGCSRPSVYRALAQLEAAGHVERFQTLRDSETFARRLDPRARRGQGVTIYRLGRALRDAAGLREVEVSEYLGLVTRGAENRSVRPPNATRNPSADAGLRPVSGEEKWHATPDDLADGALSASDETPRRDPLDRDESPARQGVSRSDDETPERRNGRTASTESYSVSPSSSAVDVRDDEVVEPSQFVSPLGGPTLEEALDDPDLSGRFIAPYGELIEDET